MDEYDVSKFHNGMQEAEIFWSRFGERPDFSGTEVLDIGCGWGSLCVDAALHGARKVVGIDILEPLVAFATEYTSENYVDAPIKFEAVDVCQYESASGFDVVLSKDTFEHLSNVPATLSAIGTLLKPGGRAFIGFAPLYHSPWGDHDRRQSIFKPWGKLGKVLAQIPWGHLFLNRLMVRTHNRYNALKIGSVAELNLNCMRFSQFENAFDSCGLEIKSLQTNVSDNVLAKICGVIRKFPPVVDYFTNSIYCVLEAPPK